LQRLPDVIACRPAKVIVWVGGNDVLALVSSKVRRFFGLWKRLPRDPSPDWFHENLSEIARGLKREAEEEIGLCSLPPMGEAPDSDDTFQRELNRRIEEYSAIIAAVTDEEGCGYISRSMRRSQRQFAPRPARPSQLSTSFHSTAMPFACWCCGRARTMSHAEMAGSFTPTACT